MVPRNRSREELSSFYERWKSHVFTFCLLYLGDESLAEEGTQEAFVNFFKQEATKPWENGSPMPLLLVQTTLIASQKRCPRDRQPVRRGHAIEDVVPFLPCEERMVFVLHSVLRLSFADVEDATGLNREQASAYWTQGALHVRQLMKER